jgi:N6-adenosine-specific RNA methylase IME4
MSPFVLIADPPWRFNDNLPGNGRGAAKHYACMSLGDIRLLMAPYCREPNAVLFLWRVAAMQLEALQLASDLGFTVKSELVWIKETATGKRAFGMGHYVRAEHETCLIATRGKARPAIHTQRSTFRAPVGVHSQKPQAFYDIVREMYPESRKVELFARTVRPGFEQHGYELGKLGEAV